MATQPDMVCPRCHGSGHEHGVQPCGHCGGAGHVSDSLLSPHFALSEMIASPTAVRRGIPNDPPLEVLRALTDLCVEVLEPLRARVGPIHIDSGYRSMVLNIAVGGAPRSAHVTGSAADCIPLAVSRRELFDAVVAMNVPFDQRIAEFGTWIHVGHKGPAGVQRHESLMIFAGTGYTPYDPADKRI